MVHVCEIIGFALQSTGVPCKIPMKTKSWTVHGIWPTRTGSLPAYCNDSWPFDVTKLAVIFLNIHLYI